MGNVSFWTCAVILLCAGGITYCHRFPHEGSSHRYRNYDQKVSYFGSKGGFGNAPPYQTFEPDYVQQLPPQGPPLTPPPIRSYSREIPPYDYQNSRLPPPGPPPLPCSEYEEDEYPYGSDESCQYRSGETNCPCPCEENCPCECPCCCGNCQCPCESEDYPCGSGSDCPCCCCCGKNGGCSCERCPCCERGCPCEAEEYPPGNCPCCGRCPCECPGCDAPEYPEEPVNSRMPPSYTEYYPIPEKRGRNQMDMRYGNDRFLNSDPYSSPPIHLPPPPSPDMPPPPPPPPSMMPPPPPPPAPIPPPPPPAPIPSYQYPPQFPPEDSYRNRQMIVTVSKTYGSPGQMPPGPESEGMMPNPQITEQTSYAYQMPRQSEIPQPRLTPWRPPPPPPSRRVMPEEPPYLEPSYGRRSYQTFSRTPVGGERGKSSYFDGLAYPDAC